MRNTRKYLTKNDLIRPEQIEFITGMDEEASERERLYIIHALGTGSEDLMIKQYCEFMGYDCREVVDFLRSIEQYEDLIVIEEDEDILSELWTHY